MISAFTTVPKLVFGAGSIESLENEVPALGGSRVMLITDAGVLNTGAADRVADVVKKSGIDVKVFHEVEPEPSAEIVHKVKEVAQAFGADLLIGLGGGSCLDVAKAASVLMTNPGAIWDYFGVDKVPKPGIPVVAIPTTAGTGSEVTSISVLVDPRDQLKKGVVSPHLFARLSVLDPVLTLELPPRLTALTGLDALVHAVESFTGIHASPFTDAMNGKAIELIGKNLRKAVFQGSDLKAREAMLYASCMAGMAFSNTQNGLAHALALALGSKYHLPHGLSTAIMLPWVMRYNLGANLEKFAKVACLLGTQTRSDNVTDLARVSVRLIEELLEDLEISFQLKHYGVKEKDFELLAKQAMSAKRLVENNPRRPSEEDIVRLLQRAY
ncbi:MAG: iron-containing alcohol dehydrogenase [Candidatus Hadarchaeum sp.]